MDKNIYCFDDDGVVEVMKFNEVEDVSSLIEIVSKNNCKKIEFVACEIKDICVSRKFAEFLKKDRRVCELEFVGCDIVREFFVNTLKENESVKSLRFTGCYFDVFSFMSVLKDNRTLKEINVSVSFNQDIDESGISDKQKQLFVEDFSKNGTVTHLDLNTVYDLSEKRKFIDEICERNKKMHRRTEESVLCLLALRRTRRVCAGAPVEMFKMLGQFLWNTRSDIEGWCTDQRIVEPSPSKKIKK